MRTRELFENKGLKPVNIDFSTYENLQNKLIDYNKSYSKLSNFKFPESSRETVHELSGALYTKIVQTERELESRAHARKDSVSIPELISTIKKECSEIVDQYKYFTSFYYTSIKHDKDFLIGKTLEQNISEKVPFENQKILKRFDDVMKAMGFRTTISNSIESTYSIESTLPGTNGYMVFPKNGFNYVWGNFNYLIYYISSARSFDLEKGSNALDVLRKSIDRAASPPEEKFEEIFRYSNEPRRFFNPAVWFKTYQVIQDAVNNKIIPREVADLFEPENLITEKSVEQLDLKENNGLRRAISSDASILMSGEYYAISIKHRSLFKRYLWN